jgi:hypothetical protein
MIHSSRLILVGNRPEGLMRKEEKNKKKKKKKNKKKDDLYIVAIKNMPM